MRWMCGALGHNLGYVPESGHLLHSTCPFRRTIKLFSSERMRSEKFGLDNRTDGIDHWPTWTTFQSPVLSHNHIRETLVPRKGG